ncbi:hypothetical protein [Dubosiella newyorkensis]
MSLSYATMNQEKYIHAAAIKVRFQKGDLAYIVKKTIPEFETIRSG